MNNSQTMDDEDDLEFIDHEVDEVEVEREAKADRPRVLVIVDNADNADRVRFWARFDVKIKRIIDRAYKRLDVPRAPNDRLIRVDNGDSVFTEEALTVREYILKYGGKARIHWEFAGDTGGA